MSGKLIDPYSHEGLKYSKKLTDEFEYDPGKRYLDQVFSSILSSVEHVYFNRVDGDIVEFGTGYGLTANFLSHASKNASQAYNLAQKKLYFFDSFEGLPEITNEFDKETAWIKGLYCGATPDDILNICCRHIEREQVNIIKGWYSETLPNINSDTLFSLIHIDSDLYDSAKTVLQSLLSNRMISEGAIVLFDDFNCHRASNDLGERRAWKEAVDQFHIHYSDVGPYSPYGWKYIIHSYSSG